MPNGSAKCAGATMRPSRSIRSSHAVTCRVRQLGIHVGRARQARLQELGRMVHEVAGDQGPLAARVDREHLVPRRVAGGVLEPQLVGHRERALRELDHTRAFERREDGGEDLPVLLVGRIRHHLPVGPVDDVAGARERRRRRVEHVPPDVVVVDVGDQHELDLGGVDPRPGELRGEAAGGPAPRERRRGLGTEPRVHQEGPAVRTHDEGMDVEAPASVGSEDLRMTLTRLAPDRLVRARVGARARSARRHDGVAERDDLDPTDPDPAVRHYGVGSSTAEASITGSTSGSSPAARRARRARRRS